MRRHDRIAHRLSKLLSATILTLSASVALAQTPSTPERAPDNNDAAPLVFWNRQIAVLRSHYDQFSPAERAARAVQRMSAFPEDPSWEVVANEATQDEHTGAIITANGQFAFAILTTDLDSESKETLRSATDRATTQLKAALEARAQQRRPSVLLRGIGFSVAATLLLVLGLWILFRSSRRLQAYLEKRASVQYERLRLGGFDLRPILEGLSSALAKLVLRAAAAMLVYLWLAYVLLRFPYSQPWGQQLGGFLIDLFVMLGAGLLRSIPGIFTVVVILFVARIVSRMLRVFFSGVERGNIKLSWAHADTAGASRHILVALIWVFAIVVAYPYIPGSNTDAFKGVSVLLGLMVSLGSAGFVNQIMSGLVVVYSRGMKAGEFVRIGDDVGTVLEVGMLSTKIRTPKREEITVPNGVLVGTRTVNYSRHTTENGAAVGTTVTIGYDVPWRQVHAMLLRAAEQTTGVRRNPAPRVHQKALSDFFVEYELVFNIDNPAERVSILSELHTLIQDAFNEEGVQIMSPHFESQPNERVFVPKSEWFRKSTQATAGNDRR